MDYLKLDALKVKTIHWQTEKVIPGTPWKIRGFSRSAYRTGFYIPDLDMMLDAGPQNFNKPKHIFITHSHVDHIANLPLTMIGDEEDKHVFELYGHTDAKDYIYNYINAMFQANVLDTWFDPYKIYNYHGLQKGDQLTLKIKGTTLKVEIFKCDHKIPTVSYGFTEVKNKLKEEYLGLPGKEIGQLRKSGINVTKEVEFKRFTFVCDTSIDVFEMNPSILEYKTVFIECTFLMDDELKNAKRTQHIHWQQLKPYVENNPHTTFVLFHFSQRYRDEEINQFFEKENLSNVICWINV